MASSNPLHDPGARNWYIAAYCLKVVKIGLHDFINSEVNACYNDVMQHILTAYNWPPGTHVDCSTYNIDPNIVSSKSYSCSNCLKTSPIDCTPGCANATLLAMKLFVLNAHRFKKITWSNTNLKQWANNEWEIAKCFIPTPGYEHTTCAEDTDLPGLLGIIINMKRISNRHSITIDCITDVFSKVRKPFYCHDLSTDSDMGVRSPRIQAVYGLLRRNGIQCVHACIHAV